MVRKEIGESNNFIPFPRIRVELNPADLMQCTAYVDTPGNLKVRAPIPYGIEAPLGVRIEPRNIRATADVLDKSLDPAVIGDIERVVCQGSLDQLQTLKLAFSCLAPCNRGLHFIDPRTQIIYVVSGVGMGRLQDKKLTITQPAPSNTISRNEYETANGLTPAVFTRLNSDGTKTKLPDDNPQGAYTHASRDKKVTGNKRFRSLGFPVITPKILMVGDYPDIKFRDQNVGWLVYSYPLSLWPFQIAALSQMFDDQFPHMDKETGYFGNRIFESWLYKSARVIRMAHNQNITHNQLHPGNTGLTVDLTGKNHPLFTDMSTVTDISDFARRSIDKIYPHLEARIIDLSTYSFFILRNQLDHIGNFKSRLESTARILAWLQAGYHAGQDQAPNLPKIMKLERKIATRLENHVIESQLLKEKKWQLLAYVFADYCINQSI